MKKIYMLIVFLLSFCILCTVQTFASRAMAPARISPVIYKNLKITAENSSQDNMGVVRALNINTDKMIWSRKVYTVKINPDVEADTQWVFIKEMKIDKDKLVVINEKGKTYILNPNTGENLNKSNPMITAIVIAIIFFIKMKLIKQI